MESGVWSWGAGETEFRDGGRFWGSSMEYNTRLMRQLPTVNTFPQTLGPIDSTTPFRQIIVCGKFRGGAYAGSAPLNPRLRRVSNASGWKLKSDGRLARRSFPLRLSESITGSTVYVRQTLEHGGFRRLIGSVCRLNIHILALSLQILYTALFAAIGLTESHRVLHPSVILSHTYHLLKIRKI